VNFDNIGEEGAFIKSNLDMVLANASHYLYICGNYSINSAASSNAIQSWTLEVFFQQTNYPYLNITQK
jgi:hypothetical protein